MSASPQQHDVMRFDYAVGRLFLWSAVAGFGGSVQAGEPPEAARQIAILQAVGKEGSGNERARLVIRELEKAEGSALLRVLEGMGGAGELGLNWLRAAAEAIVDRELAAGRPLPLVELGEFLLDTRHHPRARRYAYELTARLAPGAAERLLPGMLNDPSLELRRDAIQRLLEEAATLEREAAGKQIQAVSPALLYRQALGAARDVDQIERVVAGLRRLGQSVDLPRHFGFLMRWKVIGPFDNTNRLGFDRVFPPENELTWDAEYSGKGAVAEWQDFATADEYGVVDINKIFGPLKEAVAYACAEFESAAARPVELRLGCKNAWKIWLNGEFLFGRDEYHRGMRIDQYRVTGQLKPGKNAILIKLCQNEQTEDWTVEWQFQLRVCDAAGAAVWSENRLPTPTAAAARKKR